MSSPRLPHLRTAAEIVHLGLAMEANMNHSLRASLGGATITALQVAQNQAHDNARLSAMPTAEHVPQVVFRPVVQPRRESRRHKGRGK